MEIFGWEPVCSFHSKPLCESSFFISSGFMNIFHTCRFGGMNAHRFHSCHILIATSLLRKVLLSVSYKKMPPGLSTLEISEITFGRSRTCSRTSQQKTQSNELSA